MDAKSMLPCDQWSSGGSGREKGAPGHQRAPRGPPGIESQKESLGVLRAQLLTGGSSGLLTLSFVPFGQDIKCRPPEGTNRTT